MRPLISGFMRLAQHHSGERSVPATDSIELYIGGLEATALVERFGSPLLAIGGDRLATAAAELMTGLAAVAPPGSRLLIPYSDLPLAQLLAPAHAAGIGAAVSSLAELELALAFNPGPGDLVVDGAAPPESFLRQVLPLQPFAVRVDQLAELQLLRALARELQLQVAVSLSLAPTFDDPLGLELEGGEAERACQYLLEHHQAFTLVSLHYPLARGDGSLAPLLEFLKLLQQRYRVDVPYIDLGFAPDFPYGLAELSDEVEAFCRHQGLVQPKWVLRPGSLLGSGLGTLLTRIDSARERHSGQRFLLTDADAAIDGIEVQAATPGGPAGPLHAHYLASRNGRIGTLPASLPLVRPGQLLALPGGAIHAMAARPPVLLVTQGSAQLIATPDPNPAGADVTA